MKYFYTMLILFISMTSIVFCAQNSKVDISASDSKILIEKNKDSRNFIILDIRTPEEFSQGHIENAVNIDFYADDFSEQINKLDKNKIYLIYCRSGNRSGQSLSVFKNSGFKEYYNMLGGFSEWTKNNFPFVK